MYIKKFKEGEKIPENSNYLYSRVVKENYKPSNWSWCNCHDMQRCDCATYDLTEYHYYEVKENE